MRYGTFYKDNGGKKFMFWGITIPMQDGTIKFQKEQLYVSEYATILRKEEKVTLYDYAGSDHFEGASGLMFTDTKEPFVLAQEEDDLNGDNLVLIPVEDFFNPQLYKKVK